MVVEGEVLEVDPPHRLVQTWRMLLRGRATAAEPLTRLTWELHDRWRVASRGSPSCTSSTARPSTSRWSRGDAVQGGGGWPFILSDLKSLLETGSAMGG